MRVLINLCECMYQNERKRHSRVGVKKATSNW